MELRASIGGRRIGQAMPATMGQQVVWAVCRLMTDLSKRVVQSPRGDLWRNGSRLSTCGQTMLAASGESGRLLAATRACLLISGS